MVTTNQPQPKAADKKHHQDTTETAADQTIENQKKIAEEKVAELTELVQRTQANLENYRKQTEKRIQDIQLMAAKGIIIQLLPLIDNFELALKSIDNKEKGKLQEFVEGIELIYGQLQSLLEKNMVKVIETQGKLFDPYLHEALLKVESESPENMILEELKRGFTMHGHILRLAKVKISSGRKTTEKNHETKNNDTNNR